MELNILNLVSILDNKRHILRNEDYNIQYKYMIDIPDIYDMIIIKKSYSEKHNIWYSNYREFKNNNYEYEGETNDNLVYVNKIYTCMFNNIGNGKFICNYDKTNNYHIIIKTDGYIMYENIEQMQKQLPLKIMTQVKESNIEILKQFFNITKITSIKLSDTEINLYLFTKRETLTKAARF